MPSPPGPAGELRTTAIAPVIFVGAIPVAPFYSGLAPGLTGVYQVNVPLPAGVGPGSQQVPISAGMAHSNPQLIVVQ
jgi:uncharacterized protein (TIGR03437 family)